MDKDLKILEDKYLQLLTTRIIKVRKDKGLSQEKLAYESEISRSLMRGYERGEHNISFKNLIRIINLGLKMSVADFFSEGFEDISARKKKK